MDEQTPAPAPDQSQSGHKAWWGAIVAALMAAVMATYTAAHADFATLWDAGWCSLFSVLPCPETIAVPTALKSIASTLLDQWWKAAVTGGVVQQVIYRVNNRAK